MGKSSIPADDLNRAKYFYNKLFGWEINEVPGRQNYMLSTTHGEKHVSSSLIKRFSPKHTTTIYFDVPSVEECSARIKELGGKIVMPKKPVPGIGYFAICPRIIFFGPKKGKLDIVINNAIKNLCQALSFFIVDSTCLNLKGIPFVTRIIISALKSPCFRKDQIGEINLVRS